VWTVWTACPGRQGPLRDEEGWSSPQRHHLRLLQQGNCVVQYVPAVMDDGEVVQLMDSRSSLTQAVLINTSDIYGASFCVFVDNMLLTLQPKPTTAKCLLAFL